ncbi:phosphatidylserine decarboxylase proenzyme, mitochondrial-like isoform X3 [Acanthaster planci]|uniref:Phosphatidylserine decarboxylase proenzyme, mitochondrial n=1 Tax=Acanthaster planci TaxID=133434 RepID=A0A8B7Y3E2_ACAPL|nr:phosphatidylserine decarboxylase proenzyme, mitochondrial-like isoform X3 [Acanthaster planci]
MKGQTLAFQGRRGRGVTAGIRMETKCHICHKPSSSTGSFSEQVVRTYSSEGSQVPKVSWMRRITKGFVNYGRNLKWVPIPLGVGFAYICYQQYGHIKKRERRRELSSNDIADRLATQWQINIYKALPLRFVSRLWGQVNSVDVPYGLRKPIYSLYTRLFNCDLSEALVEDLTTYQNLSAFFRRELKPTARPLDKSKSLVSPCDGKVLHFGKVERGWMEQVKGVTYTLQGFLGPKTANQQEGEVKQVSNDHFQSRLTTKAGNRLYQCILYLAPGDYHRFHSPADWTIKHRRHFPGLLFSVNPGIARWIRGLFSLNERVVLCGEWEHGFFSMTAVGATNVGSINIYFDEELRTNKKGKFKQGEYRDHDYTAITRDSAGIRVAKGDSIGEFNLGSTIVLIFEAPKDFDFSFRPGDKVRLNAGIGTL